MIDTPGTTRDRIYGEFEWENHHYTLIDTGGLELIQKGDPVLNLIKIQVEIAVEEADLIFFVVDGREGLNPLDQHVADFLRRSGKPVVLLVNKVDDYEKRDLVHDFHSLGFSTPGWISSLHGRNVSHVLESISQTFEAIPIPPAEEDEEEIFKLAIVGQPNVGKSSLLNRFLATDRVLVTDVPGTTRDPVEVPFQLGDYKFQLVDTAGIRRVNRLKEHIDKISVIYSEKVIQKCDLALFLVDATLPLSHQDKRIAGKILEEEKPCILVINKWDLIEEKEEKVKALESIFDEKLYFFKFCPRIYLSAKTGSKIQRLQDQIIALIERLTTRVNTSQLNRLVQEAVTIHRPPDYKGRTLKIYYVTQLKKNSGTFLFKVNDETLVHFSYYRYLENTLRDFYKMEGIPLKLLFRGKKGKD
jgi:GTP-binding protein